MPLVSKKLSISFSGILFSFSISLNASSISLSLTLIPNCFASCICNVSSMRDCIVADLISSRDSILSCIPTEEIINFILSSRSYSEIISSFTIAAIP